MCKHAVQYVRFPITKAHSYNTLYNYAMYMNSVCITFSYITQTRLETIGCSCHYYILHCTQVKYIHYTKKCLLKLANTLHSAMPVTISSI